MIALRLKLISLIFVLFVLAQTAVAGPAKYDPTTRSFTITYTYAFLPSFGMDPRDVEKLGTIQNPSKDQDAKIRTLHQSASEILFDITNGKAKIGQFNHVDNIKQADIIISLTGDFGRAGWAIPGAINGRPGQVGLYYIPLANYQAREAALTVAHELMHYLFALPDEYKDSQPAQCPVPRQGANPVGPGCLMDNYFARNGFLALCDDSNHNHSAPNPSALAQGHKVDDSCHYWVEEFFKQFPTKTAADPANPVDPTQPTADFNIPPLSKDLPFTGTFKRLIESGVLFTREHATTKKVIAARRSAEPTADELSKVRVVASKYLKTQVQQLIEGRNITAKPSDAEITKAVAFIARQALAQKVEKPQQIDRETDLRLRQKAAELAAGLPKISGRQNLMNTLIGGSDLTNNPEIKKSIQTIKTELIPFLIKIAARGAIGLAPGESMRLASPEQAYIDQIAREAVFGNAPASEDCNLEAAKLQIELSKEIFENNLDLGSELDLPGIDSRRATYRDILVRLDKLALPGKPFSGFGRRRTFLLAPQPLDPDQDFVDIDAGSKIPYYRLRPELVVNLAQMIQRERIEFVNDSFGTSFLSQARFGEKTVVPMLAERPREDTGLRYTQQVQEINRMVEEIRRNRVENLILFVPPGGIPLSLSDSFEPLRKRVLNGADVRVDAILFAESTIPARLRDLIAQSGGTVQTIADVEELGVVAQRLKNEVAAGSWVVLPQQGYINLGSPNELDQKLSIRGSAAPKKRLTPEQFRNKHSSDASKQTYSSDPVNYFKDSVGKEAYAGINNWLNTLSNDETTRGRNPTLELAIAGFDDFLKSQTVMVQLELIRADSGAKDMLKPAFDRIYTMKAKLESLRDRLPELGNDPSKTIEKELQELLEETSKIKRDFRTILLGDATVSGSPTTTLNDTDDYFGWRLRQLLFREAERVASTRSIEKLMKSDSRKDRFGKSSRTGIWNQIDENQSNAINYYAYAVDLTVRAGELDPEIAKITSQINALIKLLPYNALPQVANAPTNIPGLTKVNIPGFTEVPNDFDPIAGLRFDRVNQIVQQIHALIRNSRTLETAEVAKNVHSGARFATAAELRIKKLRIWIPRFIFTNTKGDGKLSEDLPSSGLELHQILFEIRLAARDLMRAADQIIDPSKFGVLVQDLQDLYDATVAIFSPEGTLNIPSKVPQYQSPSKVSPTSAPRLIIGNQSHKSMHKDLDETIKSLKLRSVDVLIRTGSGDARIGASGVWDTTLFDEDLSRSNAISSLPDAKSLDLNQKKEIGDFNLLYDDPNYFNFYKVSSTPITRHLFEDRLQSYVYGELPRLILNTLSSIESVEDDIRALTESVIIPSPASEPLFKRLGLRRELTAANTGAEREGSKVVVEFKEFQAEADAEFEFVLGLSRPLQKFENLKANPPALELYKGKNLVNTPYMAFDPDLSRDTMLVFRIPKPDLRAGKLTPGSYTPKIRIDQKHLPVLGRDRTLNYVFSVATPRPNVQLIAALRQPLIKDDKVEFQKDKEFAFRGTVPANMPDAIVEVQVLAGASVLNADVHMMFQQINAGQDAIDNPRQELVDDGKYPDLKADDGVYTARITLPPASKRKASEYRVYVEAQSKADSKFIDLFENIPTNDESKKKNNDKEAPKVPPFQRATSLNFRAATES